MPEETRSDTVEELLAEEKAFEDRKQVLIAGLLKQREAALKDFDEKLAKLGYRGDGTGKPKRNHHKKAGATEGAAKPKTKA